MFRYWGKYWCLGIYGKKNSSLNSELQLLHSDEKNWKVSFPYPASNRILQNEQTVQSAIDQSLMVRQSKDSTLKVAFFKKISISEWECEVLHIKKVEFGDDIFVALKSK